jgi:hypothetical protein
MVKSQTDLKPCPFCGSYDIEIRAGTAYDGWDGHTAIVCRNQETPLCISQWFELSEKETIKMWNTRREHKNIGDSFDSFLKEEGIVLSNRKGG